MTSQSSAQVNTLAESLAQSKRVCVLTGAGVSKESGVPTFRDKDGLWNKFRPEELANVEAFIRNPKLVWEWYCWRRELMAGVEPNPGHYALAELETLFDDFALVTQNVDNMHQNAGSKNVIELHGNILRNKCHDCGYIFSEEESKQIVDFAEGELPRCPKCKDGLLRPDIVWFGEMLPEDAIDFAWKKAMEADIFISIGTSAVVYPAAMLPQQAKSAGAFLVEINPKRTELSPLADIVIEEPSGVALPEVTRQFKIILGK